MSNALLCTFMPVLITMMALERIGAGITAQIGMIGPMSTIVLRRPGAGRAVHGLDRPGHRAGTWLASGCCARCRLCGRVHDAGQTNLARACASRAFLAEFKKIAPSLIVHAELLRRVLYNRRPSLGMVEYRSLRAIHHLGRAIWSRPTRRGFRP